MLDTWKSPGTWAWRTCHQSNSPTSFHVLWSTHPQNSCQQGLKFLFYWLSWSIRANCCPKILFWKFSKLRFNKTLKEEVHEHVHFLALMANILPLLCLFSLHFPRPFGNMVQISGDSALGSLTNISQKYKHPPAYAWYVSIPKKSNISSSSIESIFKFP